MADRRFSDRVTGNGQNASPGQSASRVARLRALRVVGFKSFAERTALEFGPGISAIVGPNGSGKSNLADALRWALGEQGRSLRTRKAEDVIFAGSATRQATGMADVTLIIDNDDGLLPLDFSDVELGRRLYRSGENEYLLNRQRVRLRDLVDVLDGANLPDNAFLFIGQGMVDQALSLRPEERRPLFEEVAGVRRHERRRRHAESQLVEAEVNLARVRDIIAELRPQARRLAAQAEQQAARGDAAAELAEALVAAGRSRWLGAARDSQAAGSTLAAARERTGAAGMELRAAEETVAALSADLQAQAERERAARIELDELRARSTELRLAEARAHAELASHRRQVERLRAERTAAEERVVSARRVVAVPLPEPDEDLERALATVEEEIVEARRDAEGRLERHDRATRIDLARRELAEASSRATVSRVRVDELERARAEAEARRNDAASAVHSSTEESRAASAFLDERRNALQTADGRHRSLIARAASAAKDVAVLEARYARLEESLVGDESRELRALAGERGGRPILDDVDVDPGLRTVVEAALGAALHALTLADEDVMALRAHRGTLILEAGSRHDTRSAEGRALVEAALRAGGGSVTGALRADRRGIVRRLVERAVWVPDLAAALQLRTIAPIGWRIVSAAGEVVTADGIVELGRRPGILERRGERDRIGQALRDAEQRAAETTRAREEAALALAQRTDDLRAAERAVDEARTAVRRAEEAERTAARDLDSAAAELDVERAQLERATATATRARELLGDMDPDVRASRDTDPEAGPAITRVGDLERRQARLRAEVERGRAALREAEEQRRRAEIALSIDRARVDELDAEIARLAESETQLRGEVVRLSGEVAEARELERSAQESLSRTEDAEGEGRARLVDAERNVAAARETLRTAEEGLRLAERRELESRFELESAREQLLVELAALGQAALRALGQAGSTVPDKEAPSQDAERTKNAGDDLLDATDSSAAVDDSGRRIEMALESATRAWSTTPGELSEPPTAARLALLRRRYQDLGAGNPYAVEEYAELKERLEGLERERTDLESAIASTRKLIAELTTLMAERFLTTFRDLEGAFARQFEQLFGGGDARLELTDPEDLSATGIEILARPPGKKRQALAMLSGGERALTAVALLFAMLEVHPVPFCVLDEVDAALDEANIARFVGALQRLAESIQFIVITHNRGTIEAADALYGVTIGDDAISRVISLRLAGPTPLPEREREPAATGA